MKKVALTLSVLALGLAACETQTEDAVENDMENTEAAVEDMADNATGAEAERLEDMADAAEERGEAMEEAIDESDVNADGGETVDIEGM